MNDSAENERLLADVLAESAPADFREAMLGKTLRLARGRRRGRQARRLAGLAVTLGVVTVLVWLDTPRRPLPAPPKASCKIVYTQPLPAEDIVTTRPLSSAQLIASDTAVPVVHTTARSGAFRVIDDAQLLALAAPRPAVLIGVGPQSEELVFVNPEDAKGFPPN